MFPAAGGVRSGDLIIAWMANPSRPTIGRYDQHEARDGGEKVR